MILNGEEVRELYDRSATFYDRALAAYRLMGVDRQRNKVVRKLKLASGDTVFDLGCGTGANFSFLVEAVASTGRIIGVDLSGAMLERARKRAEENGWTNIQLIEADIREFAIPSDARGVIAAFALEMVPEYETAIERIAAALPLEGRLGLLGMKLPDRWPNWLVDAGIWVNRPFGVSRNYATLRPWQAVSRHMSVIEFKQMYFGGAYRCIGQVGTNGNVA